MRWLHLPLTRDDDVVWARGRLDAWLSTIEAGQEAVARLEQLVPALAKPGPGAAVEFGWDDLRQRPYCLLTAGPQDANSPGHRPGLGALERRVCTANFDFGRHGLEVRLSEDDGSLRALLLGARPCTGPLRETLQRNLVLQATASKPGASQAPEDDEARRALEEAMEKVFDLTNTLKSKDEFLAVAYHDLRSPISTAKGALEILESTMPQASDDQKHLFHIARKAFDTLVQLVSNLMSLQLLELYDDGSPRAEVDLTGVTRDVVEGMAIQARVKGIQLTSNAGSPSVKVPGDPVWIHQIASSVIHNAIKFTEKGGHVGVRVDTEPGHAVLTVEDDGVGIPPEQTERVFELLTRLRPRGTAGERGTGIGLYVAKRWVERLGGSIRIVARTPAGTRFEIRLPTP